MVLGWLNRRVGPAGGPGIFCFELRPQEREDTDRIGLPYRMHMHMHILLNDISPKEANKQAGAALFLFPCLLPVSKLSCFVIRNDMFLAHEPSLSRLVHVSQP